MSLSQLLIPGCESTDVSLWLLGVSVNVLSARLPHLLPHCPTPPSPSEQVRLLYWGRNYEIEIEAREAIETSRLGSRVGHHLPIPGCPGKSSAMQEQIFRGATWKSIHLSHGNIQKGNMKIHLPHTSLKFRNVIFTETDFAVHSIQILELPIPLSSSVSYKNLDHFSFYCISQTWLTGFVQSFLRYFSPPDFNISFKHIWIFWWLGAQVTRHERPKGAKDEVKWPEETPAWSVGPEGPKTSSAL